MNGGAQYSKACEGASLPWVQIPPPPPLTCDDASPPCLLRGGGHRRGLSFGPQMVSVDRAEMPRGRLDRTRTPALHCGRHDLGGDPGGSLSAQVEALVQADAPGKPGAGFPVSSRAAEPTRTPPKRAPCRSRLVGTVRDRPDTCQLTDRITLIETFWRTRALPPNAQPPRPGGRGGYAFRFTPRARPPSSSTR